MLKRKPKQNGKQNSEVTDNLNNAIHDNYESITSHAQI